MVVGDLTLNRPLTKLWDASCARRPAVHCGLQIPRPSPHRPIRPRRCTADQQSNRRESNCDGASHRDAASFLDSPDPHTPKGNRRTHLEAGDRILEDDDDSKVFREQMSIAENEDYASLRARSPPTQSRRRRGLSGVMNQPVLRQGGGSRCMNACTVGCVHPSRRVCGAPWAITVWVSASKKHAVVANAKQTGKFMADHDDGDAKAVPQPLDQIVEVPGRYRIQAG